MDNMKTLADVNVHPRAFASETEKNSMDQKLDAMRKRLMESIGERVEIDEKADFPEEDHMHVLLESVQCKAG